MGCKHIHDKPYCATEVKAYVMALAKAGVQRRETLSPCRTTGREVIEPAPSLALPQLSKHDEVRQTAEDRLSGKPSAKSWRSTVIASGLPSDLKKEEVMELFSTVGALQHATVTVSPNGGSHGLEATVVFQNTESIPEAVRRFNAQLFDGEPITVAPAPPPGGRFDDGIESASTSGGGSGGQVAEAAQLPIADNMAAENGEKEKLALEKAAQEHGRSRMEALSLEKAALEKERLKLVAEKAALQKEKEDLEAAGKQRLADEAAAAEKKRMDNEAAMAARAKLQEEMATLAAEKERDQDSPPANSLLAARISAGAGAPATKSSIFGRLGKKPAPPPAPGTVVHVAGLPKDVGKNDIMELFGTVGKVVDATVVVGELQAGATVIFADTDGAKAVVAEFHGRELDGKAMTVVIEGAAKPAVSQSQALASLVSSPSSSNGRPVSTAVNVASSSNAIPIFASPIMMFDKKTGAKYADGTAPKKSSLFFPSLTSARWSDPNNDIYMILNFAPHPDDLSELNALNVKVIDADACLEQASVKTIYSEFSESCPIGGKADLGGSGIIGVMRFFLIQGAMEMMNLEMVFFLEGDNLLLRPVQFLAEIYRLRENKVDATITHISFHVSFLGYDFVRQMNEQARSFALFTNSQVAAPSTPPKPGGRCFLTGGGQDMRLGYEAAKFLQISRRSDGKSGDARILNTAGGTVPCGELYGERRWINSLGLWCEKSGDKNGPCALEPGLKAFNAHNGEKWTSDTAEYLPFLLECDPQEVNDQELDNSAYAKLGAPGSLQQNLKGKSIKQSPGDCGEMDTGLCDGTHTDNVEVSTTFYCNEEWVKANPTEQNNKALYFMDGRAYSVSSSSRRWVEHYNLHYQGGGCKSQMKPTFIALLRSSGTSLDGAAAGADLNKRGFTCEESKNLRVHERCLFTGEGALDWGGPMSEDI